MKRKRLKSNIWKLFVLRSIMGASFFMPIIVLFFQENGLSMKEVFLLQALFSVSVIVLEIPSGYFSDIFGRKRSIVIGSFSVFIGYVIYSIAQGFWSFLAAEFILGFGISFVSGSDSALLYDTLVELRDENQYTKAEGRLGFTGLMSEGIASILGGFMAMVSLRFPLVCEAVITFLALPIALMLIEPNEHLSLSERIKLKDIIRLVFNGNIEVKWLIAYSAVVSSSTLTMVWFIQPYWKSIEMPQAAFGICWAVLMFFSAFISWHSFRLEEVIGKKHSLILLIVISSAGYFILSWLQTLWAGVFILLFYFVRGLSGPIFMGYVNKLVSSNVRATVLSIKNLVQRMAFSIIGPLMGWISDAYSLQSALAASGGTFLLLGLIILFIMNKHDIL